MPQKVNISSLRGGVQVKKLELSLNPFFSSTLTFSQLANSVCSIFEIHTHTHIYIHGHICLLSPILHFSTQLSSLHLIVAMAFDLPASLLAPLICYCLSSLVDVLVYISYYTIPSFQRPSCNLHGLALAVTLMSPSAFN